MLCIHQVKEPAVHSGDQKSQTEPASFSAPAGSDTGTSPKESPSDGETHTVRASLFENVIERRSVLVVEGDDPKEPVAAAVGPAAAPSTPAEDDGTLVTATYREPEPPNSGLLRVSHSFDTVPAVEGSRAVSESLPLACLEDKAMTLRSRRSAAGPAAAPPEHRPAPPVQGGPAFGQTPEVQPRYLRVGALPKWNAADAEQEARAEGRPPAPEAEGEEAAPKRLKTLGTDDQPKPKATYFALTGQIQEAVSPGDGGPDRWFAKAGTLEDPPPRSGPSASQGKSGPTRNPSFEEVLRKNQSPAQEPVQEPPWVTPVAGERMVEMERQRDQSWNAERRKTRTGELEMLRQVEIERHQHLEFARMKERQREHDRQVAFEQERLREVEQQRALEREKQQVIEREKQRDLERQREVERERQRNQDRQRELDKEKKQLEIQWERQQHEKDLEKIKEMERRE